MIERVLRTPRGVFLLIVATYAGAVAVALFVAANRAFFEGKVREKLPETREAIRDLARSLEEGRSTPAEVRAFDAATRRELYSAWLRGDAGKLAPGAVPRALAAANRDELGSWLERTLVAGSEDQRVLAAKLAGATGDRALAPLVRWALARERAARRDTVAGALLAALATLEPERSSDG